MKKLILALIISAATPWVYADISHKEKESIIRTLNQGTGTAYRVVQAREVTLENMMQELTDNPFKDIMTDDTHLVEFTTGNFELPVSRAGFALIKNQNVIKLVYTRLGL